MAGHLGLGDVGALGGAYLGEKIIPGILGSRFISNNAANLAGGTGAVASRAWPTAKTLSQFLALRSGNQ